MRSHTILVVAKSGRSIAPGTPQSHSQNTKEKTTRTGLSVESPGEEHSRHRLAFDQMDGAVESRREQGEPHRGGSSANPRTGK